MNVIEGGKKDPRNRSLFPISPRAVTRDVPTRGNATEIENFIEGGITLREHVAIEFACAMLSNPAIAAGGWATIQGVFSQAVKQADDFFEKLEPSHGHT